MGLDADAELIWGIPVEAYDEEGQPTVFWDEDRDDWRKFEGEIEVRQYGHYENPDGKKGILTSARVKVLMGDCWDPQVIYAVDMAVDDKTIRWSDDQAQAAGLPVSFYDEAEWRLVASYG